MKLNFKAFWLGFVLIALVGLILTYRVEMAQTQALTTPRIAAPTEQTPLMATRNFRDRWRLGRPATTRQPPAERQPVASDDLYDPTLLGDTNYLQRIERHRQIRLMLKSPARETLEWATIMDLCQRHDLPPWTVLPAYDLAYEGAGLIRDGLSPTFSALTMSDKAARAATRLGLDRWPPGFLDELLEVQPTVFSGPGTFDVGQPGDKLLDRTGWNEL